MRIFLAGATGAVGRRLVPALVGAGHEVTGTTRSLSKTRELEGQGARAVVLDALDAEGVGRAVAQAEPEVVVNQLTDLGAMGANMRRFDSYFATTNRLRTEGNDHLLSAARAAGARRLIAQSFTGWPFARVGGSVKHEDDPLDPSPPPGMRAVHAAIRHLEEATTGAEDVEGVVLRYGFFYGPGTSLAADPAAGQTAAIHRRRVPLVGDGGASWSFTHVDDAAGATLAALEGGGPGLYQAVDDEPALVREWLPAFAEAVGAPPPRRVPRPVARVLAGPAAVMMMCEARGAANHRARTELGWTPRWPSWREGFARGLGG